MFVHRHSLGLYDIFQWMEYFNTDKRQEKKKEKQNQLFLTPVITVSVNDYSGRGNIDINYPAYLYLYHQVYQFSI